MVTGEVVAVPLADMSTAAINDVRKFDYFCDAICDVYAGVQPVEPDDRVFDAEFKAVALSQGVLASIASPGHMADRGALQLRRRPEESLFLNLSEFSAYGASHVGEDWRVAAGRPFLLDNARPFHLDFERERRMRLYSLRLDRQCLGLSIDQSVIAKINHAIATTELGRSLELQMRLMCRSMGAGEIMLAGTMSRPVTALLARIAENVAAGPSENSCIDLATIKAVARQHLSVADFGLEDLARLLRCSARTVQSRFAGEGTTFGRWQLEARLDLVRDRLEHSTFSGRTIEAIALATGFRDASHFHRAFKKRFGISPGQARH